MIDFGAVCPIRILSAPVIIPTFFLVKVLDNFGVHLSKERPQNHRIALNV
jgi:hypothetical protein